MERGLYSGIVYGEIDRLEIKGQSAEIHDYKTSKNQVYDKKTC